MRKTYFILTTFIIAALLLAACSANKPATLGPGVQNTPAIQTGAPEAATTETSPAPATTQIAGTQMPTQPASAATPQVTTPAELPSTGSSSQLTDIGRVSNLLQLPVLDQNNQPVGSVQDMVLDLKGLQAEYVIVSLSQASGTAAKQVAVPWKMLTIQAQSPSSASISQNAVQGAVLFNGDQQKLENAPEFNPDALPQFGQPAGSWDSAIRDYWGIGQTGTSSSTPYAPAGTQSPSVTSNDVNLQGVVLASKVMQINLAGPNSQPMASVSDIILNPDSGELQYVLISVSSIPGISNSILIPVPLKALSWNAQNNRFEINIQPQALLNAPKFAQGQFPLTTNPNWDAQIKAFWQKYINP